MLQNPLRRIIRAIAVTAGVAAYSLLGLRNQQIIQNADLVLAFWDHSSRGTKHAIYLALKMEKELRVWFRISGAVRP